MVVHLSRTWLFRISRYEIWRCEIWGRGISVRRNTSQKTVIGIKKQNKNKTKKQNKNKKKKQNKTKQNKTKQNKTKQNKLK
jgi:hypothetical protein